MKEIVITSKAKETLDNLLSLQVRGENALAQIQQLADVPCEDINTLTKPFITSFVAQKVAQVERTSFLTTETKQTLIAEWRDKEKVSLKAIKTIQEYIEACQPQAIVSIEDGELVTSLSLKEIADNQSLLEVPEKAETHYSKIMAIRDAIADLREFEKVEDLIPMSIGRACNITEDELSLLWASDSVHRDHRWDHLIERAERQGRLINIGR